MRRLSLLCALLLGSVALCVPASAKVFFRVAASPFPSSDKTGIKDVVLPWPLQDSSAIAQLDSQGYRVWLQCESKGFADAINTAEHAMVAGVIIANDANSNQPPFIKEILSTMAAHKNTAFRVLISGGKQPQMKGRLVVEHNGVLQVSSPSTQPWLDTNLAMVRLTQATYPDAVPTIYDFRLENTEAPAGAWKPDVEDFALAIAEADADRADVIIDFPAALQKALNEGDPQAWALWKKVKAYLEFSLRAPTAKATPVAGTGVIVDDVRASYEPVNLMARHNLAFEAIGPSALTPTRLSTWNSTVVFCALNAQAAAMLGDFAAKGGIVIFVNPRGEFPWHSTAPSRRESHTTTYTIGSGEIVELDEPVIDPENFARDIRRLIGPERSAIALWNSLTTLVTGYREEGRSETTLYLVNYADQPDNVQVQVKGHFTQVRWESPEVACCASLPFVERNGFTEFTIPSLRITARVHLDSGMKNSTAH
jgi:hypothetical protein